MAQTDTYLYNWMFHYNPLSNKHFAFHREDYRAYLNGTETKYPVIKSSSHESLLAILRHFKGDPTKLIRHEETDSIRL